MRESIKYIGYYDIKENVEENRGYSLAATSKMDYICKAINENGYNVQIVSPSRTKNNKYYKGKNIRLNNHNELKLLPTLPHGSKIQNLVSRVFGYFILFYYLITQTKKNETILVYHSMGLGKVINLAKKIKKFKVILEVEEIYQDVLEFSRSTKILEYKIFESADKFIFPTHLLNEKINNKNKPFVVVHGNYQIEDKRNNTFKDDRIHVVYAGTFEPRKGAEIAAETAKFLSDNYHVHIIGFGSKDQTRKIRNLVESINKKTDAKLTYDGLLKGEEYVEFLQKCHIGLSTQDPTAEYNNTSFPSKNLSYMANGLRVVTIRIKAIEESAIKDEVFFYTKQDPKEIAKVISKINLAEPYDSRSIIRELDKLFVTQLSSLMR